VDFLWKTADRLKVGHLIGFWLVENLAELADGADGVLFCFIHKSAVAVAAVTGF
jgi:hypothetical protein